MRAARLLARFSLPPDEDAWGFRVRLLLWLLNLAEKVTGCEMEWTAELAEEET